jgi:hypothetical protein
MLNALSQKFDDFRTWGDMYDGCEMETKKMMLSRIMKDVRVRRDYEIDFTTDFEQIRDQDYTDSLQANYADDTPQKNCRSVKIGKSLENIVFSRLSCVWWR